MGAPNPGWSLPFTGVTPNRALNGLAANTLDWNTIGTHNCRCREYDFTKLVDMFLMISAYPNLKETLRLLPDLFSLHPLGKAALSRMPGASWCFQVKANLRFDFFSWAIFIYVLYELLVPLSSSPHPSKTSICTHHRTPRVPRVTDLKTPPPPSLSCTRHPPTAPRPQNHHVNLPVQGSPSAAGSAQAPPPRFWFNWPQGQASDPFQSTFQEATSVGTHIPWLPPAVLSASTLPGLQPHRVAWSVTCAWHVTHTSPLFLSQAFCPRTQF